MSTPKGYTRLSPGLYSGPKGRYRKVGNKFILLPKDSKSVTGEKGKGSGKVRGREITTHQPAEAAQMIYGTMRVGGSYSFIDTNSDTKAYLISQQDTSAQLIWHAKIAGDAGNLYNVEYILGDTSATTANFAVDGSFTNITVSLKRSGSTPVATANQVIAAVAANSALAELVRVTKGPQDGTGTVELLTKVKLSYGGGTWLHQYITLCCHQISSIEKLYLDNKEVTFTQPIDATHPDPRWADGIFEGRCFFTYQFGQTDQVVQPDLNAQRPDLWTANHRQCGFAGGYLITVFNENVYPNGAPEVAFLVHGKPVYDPRTTLTAFSNNAALIIADYLITPEYNGGCGYSYAQIDEAQLIVAADICDETIAKAGGGTEPRYCIDGVFDTSENRQRVLEDMARAIAGTVVRQEGKWFIIPGKWRTPVMSLDENDLRSAIKISTAMKGKELYNGVKGTFVSPDKKYTETDYTPVKNATYLTQDGGKKRYLDFPQPLTQSSSACQRIGKIALEAMRQGIEFSGSFSLRCFQLSIGDNVYFSLDKYGWEAKTFEVKDMTFKWSEASGFLIDLVLRETAEAIFTWSQEETTIDIAPNTELPEPTTAHAVTGLVLTSGTDELYLKYDGTVVSRIKLVWDQATDIFVLNGGHYEVQYRDSASVFVTYYNIPTFNGDAIEAYIADVKDGHNYQVRIRALNALNVASGWTESSITVVGKLAPPSDVASITSTVDASGILLSWADITDLDRSHYILRMGNSWDDFTETHQVSNTSYKFPIMSAGAKSFFVKAVDTSGNLSTTATGITVSIEAFYAPTVQGAWVGADLVLSWDTPVGVFPVNDFKVSYGSSFAGSTVITTLKTNQISIPVDWSGARRFWVVARDILGGEGDAGNVDTTVSLPSAPVNLRADALDMFAMLKWEASTVGSLPVARYEIRKGASWAAGTLLGQVTGTFFSQLETGSGVFTYWVAAQDTAGNYGTAGAVALMITQRTDFELIDNVILDPNDATTATNVIVDSTSSFIAPANETETWQEHFDNNSWTTMQDAIDDGFAYYLQPTPATFDFVQTYDFGAIVSAANISLTWVTEAVAGVVSLVTELETSDDNSTWITHGSSTSVYATNFRYVRLTWAGTGDSTEAFARYSAINLRLYLKKVTDGGIVTVPANSASGVQVTFNYDFVDITSVSVVAQQGVNSNKTLALWKFVDTGGVQELWVYVVDPTNGNILTVNCDVSWQVTGV